MKKYALFLAACALAAGAFGCGGAEIDENPAPFKWGETVFQAKRVEKSRKQEIWSGVTFNGYGKSGEIGRVSSSGGEIAAENFSFPGYSAEKLLLKGVSGDYRAAFNFYLSGEAERYFRQPVKTPPPDASVEYFAAENEKMERDGVAITVRRGEARNLGVTRGEKLQAEDIAVRESGSLVKISRVSCAKFSLPPDIENHPEKILIDALEISGVSAPELNASVERLRLDSSGGSSRIKIENASVPGAVLAVVGIPDPPAIISGSFDGSVKADAANVALDGALNLKDLLDLRFDAAGNLGDNNIDRVDFTLKDLGALRLLSENARSQLALMGAIVPGGAQAIAEFLSKPGQTISGKIVFTPGAEDYSFSVK